MTRTKAPRPWADAGFLALCIAVAGLASIAKGQDANWDLQNYHYYDPWALVHGRLLGFDVVAAQLQTFHNPALDLPFFAMIASDWPPRLVAFALAIPAGVAAFLLAKIVVLLVPGEETAARFTLRIAAFAIGITGAIGWAVLGTTMNEWPIAALTLGAIYILLRAIAAAPETTLAVGPLFAAGLIAGLGSGLKLTAATFALAMCVALVVRRPRFRNLLAGVRDATWFALAVICGLAVSIGWWWWTLWSQFANPVFPYLNQWFRSPWWDAWPVLERAFGPFTFKDWLSFPYDMFRPKLYLVAEVAYRDARVPALYTLALVAGAVSLIAYCVSPAARRRARTIMPTSAPWYFLGAFWLAAFVLWTAQHSIYRYFLPLELLSGALIVGLARLLIRPRALPVAVTILALTVIGTTRWPDWGHVPFRDRWFVVSVAPVPKDALVILASDAPLAYLLPHMTPTARFVGGHNNVIRPGEGTMLTKWSERTIREHAGPLYSLAHDEAMAAQVYAAQRLAEVPGSCSVVRTNMPGWPVKLCRLERTR